MQHQLIRRVEREGTKKKEKQSESERGKARASQWTNEQERTWENERAQENKEARRKKREEEKKIERRDRERETFVYFFTISPALFTLRKWSGLRVGVRIRLMIVYRMLLLCCRFGCQWAFSNGFEGHWQIGSKQKCQLLGHRSTEIGFQDVWRIFPQQLPACTAEKERTGRTLGHFPPWPCTLL